MTKPPLPQSLDAHARALLDRSAALAAAIPATELTIARRRTLMHEGNALLLPAEGPLPVPREDLQIDLPARSLRARLYRGGDAPTATAAADVLLVFFHGGGWVTGDLDTHDNACAFLAQRLGCKLLSVEYRKAPEHPFPAPCDDAAEAYAWAAAQAAAWGCSRIAVGGDSAGGHLAAHALFANAQVATAAALLFYPVADVNFANTSYLERGSGPGLTGAAMVWFWQQFMGSSWHADTPPADPQAVLMQHRWTRKPPPTVLAVAWHDPLHDEGIAYAGLLQKAGAEVTLHTAGDMAHGYLRMCRVNAAARAHVEHLADSLLAVL